LSARSDLFQLARSSAADSLPSDYVELTGRRCGIAAAGAAVLHAIYLVLYQTVWASERNPVGFATGVIGLAISIAVAWYLLRKSRSASHVTSAAVAYELFLTFNLALSECWAMPYTTPSPQVPWGAVVIVLFPFVIPAAPRIVLTASLAAAAMTPLAILLHHAITAQPLPALGTLASFVLPPFMCAFLAWAPTSALYRLGTAVQSARRLGNYELTERLGQGGMGEVWRANHRLLARPAAVKLIKPEVLGAKDPQAREALLRRFEKEAQFTATLDSVHTVELYDFGVSSEGVLFYVMELLSGLDVQELVERFGPLPSERVIHLLIQACDSLEDAHRRGLVHRDIKPANLFVARKGVICDFLKVLDFGLVKRWAAKEDPALLLDSLQSQPNAPTVQTNLGQIVGTPAFLAPEAALGEQASDSRADLYALGCVGYFMLTAKLVFEQNSAIALAIAHVTQEPAAPSARADVSIHPDLERLILDCLQKDRERRPSSAAELRRRLSSIAVAEPWTNDRAAQWWHEHMSPPAAGVADSPAVSRA
jgi:eukaryotic-like serine/threonine-protein kinase